MPTCEAQSRFWRDWKGLTTAQKRAFAVAVAQLVADLESAQVPRAGLRVKKVQGHVGVWEMSWAPDGRATFSYGTPVRADEAHLIWRRVGTHEIFNRP